MKQLVKDLKTLIINNWKIILVIIVVFFILSNYTEIKSGIIDGWAGK